MRALGASCNVGRGYAGAQLSTLLQFITVFFAGMLAGTEAAIHYGVAIPEALNEQAKIQLRQALVRRLRVLVPALFVPTAVLGIAVAILAGTTSGAWLRCAGLLALLTWAVVRVIRTVPINRATLSWDPAAPPRNWRALVGSAEQFHGVGVWAAAAAFACFLAAASR